MQHLTYSLLDEQPTEGDLDSIVLGNLNRSISDAHPATAGVLQFFRYGHLGGIPRATAREFAITAVRAVDGIGVTGAPAELTVALRKLLEAKDAAVRAAITPPAPVSNG